jgi:hypothetical protein
LLLRSLSCRLEPSANGITRELVERAHLEVPAGFAFAFEEALRVGVSAGSPWENQVDVPFEAGEGAYDFAI